MRTIKFLCLLLLATSALAATNYTDTDAGRQLLKDIQEEGLDINQAQQLLADAKRQDKIIKAMQSPAESRLTWKEYGPLFLDQKRIELGAKFIRQHQAIFDQVEKQYGVPAEIIAAIIGVETRYGGNIGSFRVIDALATLAFDYPPRSNFFTKELKNFLHLCIEENLNCQEERGSYAGAMGWPQFMPSSYRHYAVDFNNNGSRDLWHEPEDIIASVANYLAKNGWQKNQPVAAPANIENADRLAAKKLSHTQPHYRWNDLQKIGTKIKYNPTPNTSVGVLKFAGQQGTEYWIGLPNFFVITTYNRSPLYAMAVYQLSRKIQAAHTGNKS